MNRIYSGKHVFSLHYNHKEFYEGGPISQLNPLVKKGMLAMALKQHHLLKDWMERKSF
jgi:hypothetical protein